MALAPLAVEADLSARGIDVTDAALVAVMLAEASASVREAAGAPISECDSVVVLSGVDERWLSLPGQPVTAVSSVLLDGAPVTNYRLRSGALWRACGWQSACGEPSEVTVTMTHGLAEVPADIVGLVASLAAAGINAAREGYEAKTGIVSESIDDYRVQYETGSAATAGIMELPERTRLSLRHRFGGGSYVTSSR